MKPHKMRRTIALLLGLALCACSTPFVAYVEAEGLAGAGVKTKDGIDLVPEISAASSLKLGIDGRYVYAIADGEEIGYDLKERKRIDPALAKSFVFPGAE